MEQKMETHDVMASENGNKKRKNLLIVFIVIILLLLVGSFIFYFSKVNYYKNNYFANTTINGIQCSEKASNIINAQLLDTHHAFVLSVKGCNDQEVGNISGNEIGVKAVLSTTPANLLEQQKALQWIFENRKNHDYQIEVGFSYDETLLNTFFEQWELFDQDHMIASTDAYIGDYSLEEKAYVIVPDEFGTELDVEKAKAEIRTALENGESEVSISDCYVPAKVRADDKVLVAHLKKINDFIQAKIDYDWNGVAFTLDSDQIHEWITIGKGSITLDKEKITDFVTQCAEQYDTYGKDRSFKTIHGTELVLPSGAYGWKTDIEKETDELYELIMSGEKTSREPLFQEKGWVKGQEDIGNTFVEIDLTNQHLYVWKDGVVDFESDLVSGCKAARNSTPPGVFGVTYKARNATLKGPTWNSFVRYWMPFNKSIGMHDASWRKEFGGDIYLKSGSHGCVNLPRDAAEKMYNCVSKGFPVVCYYLPEVEEGNEL